MSEDKILEIINKSGNTFHYKVVDFLRDSGWQVLVSPYYNDGFTEKPREVDIIAEKTFEIKHGISGWLGVINVRLFIECKFITNDTVFWFDKRDRERAIERVIFDTSLDHPERSTLTNNHHYLNGSEVAKLFCSEKGGSSETEVMFKAVTQSLNSMIYYKNKPTITISEWADKHRPEITLDYPIISCNSFEKFWGINMVKKDGPNKILENFQLEVQYAYLDPGRNSKNEYYLIDVVDFNLLGKFITSLEGSDIRIVRDKIIWDKATRPAPRIIPNVSDR